MPDKNRTGMHNDRLTNVNSQYLLEKFADSTGFPIKSIATVNLVNFMYVHDNTILIRPGNTDYNIYFIIEGFGGIYGVTDSDDRKYMYLQKESRIMCSLATLAYGKPAAYYYEIQRGGKLAVIDDRQLSAAACTDPDISLWYTGIMKRALARFEKRIQDFVMKDTRSRLLELYSQSPEIFTEAMHKQIASFLGITPGHLSRLLSSKSTGAR